MNNILGEFILTLLHAATNTHILHWRTKSFADHMALNEFYQAMPELIDAVVEAIQGRYGMLIEYPVQYYAPAATGLEELQQLKEYVDTERHLAGIPQDSEIQNLIDEISAQIDSTLYKLTFLK
jgi:DNA-binding ferritin-like protein